MFKSCDSVALESIKLNFLLYIQELLCEEKLGGVPILVYANKQDLIGKSHPEITLIKKSVEFFHYMRKFRTDQVQSHTHRSGNV